jgi:hypothetical protein
MPRRPPRRSGDRGRRNLLAAVATGIAGIGLGANVLKPSAYTSARAGRSASANVADDPNAVLGLEGLNDTSVTPTFTNQSDATMDITLDAVETGIEWDVGDDGTYEQDPVTFQLSSGAFRDIAVKGANEVTVNITADLTSNGTVTGRIELERVIDVPQSNVVQEIQGSAKAAGNSGKYEFDLENTGDIDVTLVGVGVNETTNPDAASVGKNGILLASGQSVVSTPIPVDSSAPNEDTRVDFDRNVALGAGTTKSFEFDRFLDSNGNNAKMKDEDLRVTFYFSDGSSGVVELCLNGCNF